MPYGRRAGEWHVHVTSSTCFKFLESGSAMTKNLRPVRVSRECSTKPSACMIRVKVESHPTEK